MAPHEHCSAASSCTREARHLDGVLQIIPATSLFSTALRDAGYRLTNSLGRRDSAETLIRALLEQIEPDQHS